MYEYYIICTDCTGSLMSTGLGVLQTALPFPHMKIQSPGFDTVKPGPEYDVLHYDYSHLCISYVNIYYE